MKFFLLSYDFGPDYMEKRAPYRDAHMAHLNAAIASGSILVAGALMEGGVESMAIFRAEDRGVVEAYARTDPYVIGGLVASWRVREWIAIAGPGAPERA